jgi:hypothetical protein
MFNIFKIFRSKPHFMVYTWNKDANTLHNIQSLIQNINDHFYEGKLILDYEMVPAMDEGSYELKDVQIKVKKDKHILIFRINYFANQNPDTFIKDISKIFDRLNLDLELNKNFSSYVNIDNVKSLTDQKLTTYYFYDEEPKYAPSKVRSIHVRSPFHHVLSLNDVKAKLAEYKQMGLFELLAPEEVDMGYKYSMEYVVFEYDALLWNFKNFIYECSVPESMGWESELEGFASITNGAITFTNFSKVDNEEDPIFVDIGIDINGERFYCNKLTDNFTFRFIKELNKFFDERHQAIFLNFVTFSSPYQQQNFMYISSNYTDELTQLYKEFEYISDETIDFYEKEYC